MYHDIKEAMVGKTIVDIQTHGEIINVYLSDGTMIEFSTLAETEAKIGVCQVITKDEIKLLK